MTWVQGTKETMITLELGHYNNYYGCHYLESEVYLLELGFNKVTGFCRKVVSFAAARAGVTQRSLSPRGCFKPAYIPFSEINQSMCGFHFLANICTLNVNQSPGSFYLTRWCSSSSNKTADLEGSVQSCSLKIRHTGFKFASVISSIKVNWKEKGYFC